MGEVTHLPSERSAIQTILGELDWAYAAQMVLIDLIGDIPGHESAINYPNLRKAAADRMKKSVRQRDAAIRVLDGKLS